MLGNTLPTQQNKNCPVVPEPESYITLPLDREPEEEKDQDPE